MKTPNLKLLLGLFAEHALPSGPLLLQALGGHASQHLVVLLQGLAETLLVEVVVVYQVMQPHVQVLQLLPANITCL